MNMAEISEDLRTECVFIIPKKQAMHHDFKITFNTHANAHPINAMRVKHVYTQVVSLDCVCVCVCVCVSGFVRNLP